MYCDKPTIKNFLLKCEKWVLFVTYYYFINYKTSRVFIMFTPLKYFLLETNSPLAEYLNIICTSVKSEPPKQCIACVCFVFVCRVIFFFFF